MTSASTQTARAQFMRGLRAVLPIVIGIIPFGLVTGVAAVNAGIETEFAFAMGWLVFAGASQLAVAELYGQGAPELLIILTAFIINARFFMYSAGIAPYFRRLPIYVKACFAYILTDQAYGIVIQRWQAEPSEARRGWYYLGAALPFWVVWQIASLAGVLLGQTLPAAWSLDFAVPLSFLAILMPALRSRPSWVAAIVGGGTAVLLAPTRFGVLAGALLGIAAGYLVERVRARGG